MKNIKFRNRNYKQKTYVAIGRPQDPAIAVENANAYEHNFLTFASGNNFKKANRFWSLKYSFFELHKMVLETIRKTQYNKTKLLNL